MIQALDIWLPAWRRREKYFQHTLGVRHIMIAVCDRFTPAQGSSWADAAACLDQWRKEFPKMEADFRDAGGIPPRHTFFYPIEQYDREIAEPLADLCRQTGCETEILLHHENDTAENLRRTLHEGTERLARHGLLAHDEAGAPRFGFIHGHGALDNSHPDGHYCGVRNELTVLRQAGCYADFTLPTAPQRTQTRTINSLYYARGRDEPKSHDRGRRVRADRHPQSIGADELLLVQGPLAPNWQKKRYGFLPGIETGELTPDNPPTGDRLRHWLDCRIAVDGRPNWFFVKLQTDGANPETTQMLLGEPMRAFHRSLAEMAATDDTLRFHYVTAREMVNILHAAESGHSGEPGRFRDYRYRREIVST